jgi:Uri superfamily endonuclease
MLQLDCLIVIMHRSTSGIYVVIAELPEATYIQIGRRRAGNFEAGFYGYVGSALSGLERRLARHLGNRKRLYWHIDYLLNVATVRDIIYAETSQRKECLVAQNLSRKLVPQPHFGCSDCKCPSHLFFCRDLKDLIEAVLDSFTLLGLKPLKIKDSADLDASLSSSLGRK